MSALRFVGAKGSGLPDVPGRDLSAEEVEKYGKRLIDLIVQEAQSGGDKELIALAKKHRPEKLLLDSGLYEKRGGGKAAEEGE